MTTLHGYAVMVTVMKEQISQIMDLSVSIGRKEMESIRQMLSVIHVENELIMRMLVKIMYDSKTAKKIEEDLIGSFEKEFDKAARGELTE